MSTKHILRVAAIAWSVTLAGSFVYVKAGGTLWLVPSRDADAGGGSKTGAAPKQLRFLSGGDSAAVDTREYLPPSQESAAAASDRPTVVKRTTIVPSSKYIVLTPSQESALAPTEKPTPPKRTVILSSSKSLSGGTTIEAGPLASPSAPTPPTSGAPSRKTMMYGSKSAPVFDRSAEGPPSVAPSHHTAEPQPQQAPRKTMISGSKSAIIFERSDPPPPPKAAAQPNAAPQKNAKLLPGAKRDAPPPVAVPTYLPPLPGDHPATQKAAAQQNGSY